MAVKPLDNAAWGFDSNCFVCEPSNPAGLRIPFAHDEEAGAVVAGFTLGAQFSGAPRYVHGGVVLAVLDEAMAWAAIALAGRFAVVAETTTRFEHGVLVGEPHRVEARIGREGSRTLDARAEVYDAAGRRCARSSARLVVLTATTARSAIGDVAGDDTRFLRGPQP
jgi:acyl-coenzyme A thioesterase PaaI-like protein